MTAGPTERGFLTFEGRKGRETVQRKKDGHVLLSPFSLWKEFPVAYVICGELFWGQELEVEIYMMMVIASQNSLVVLIRLVLCLCLEHFSALDLFSL